MNTVETADIATGGTAGAGAVCGIVAAFTGPGGAACAAVAAPSVIQAIRADNRNMCLKIKFSPPTFPFVGSVATWPDICSGGYCK